MRRGHKDIYTVGRRFLFSKKNGVVETTRQQAESMKASVYSLTGKLS